MHKIGLLLILPALVAASTPAASAERGSSPAILFERNGDLYAISFDGSRMIRLTSTPVWDEEDPAASPDGRMVAYVRRRYGDGVIWAMRVDGTQRRRLTSRDSSDPAWSPDGRTIYFTGLSHHALSDPCYAIFEVGVERTRVERVTDPRRTHGATHFQPAVAPDGRTVAVTESDYCAGGVAGFALGVFGIDGRPTDDLARLPGNARYDGRSPYYTSSTWSPDGDRLAFAALPPGALFTAARDGSELRRVTPKRLIRGFFSAKPAWSPDGHWIAFAGGPTDDLYVVRPDGTGLRRLTRTKAAESSPAWLPALPTR